MNRYGTLPKSLMLLVLLMMTAGACERYEPVSAGVNCSECYQTRPEWLQLNAKVTINDQNPYVPLEIYIGDFENGQLDWVDTTWREDYWVDVKPDRYYSVRAKYRDGSKTIYTIDGDDVKLKLSRNDCDAECYYQKGGYVDVRLRD